MNSKNLILISLFVISFITSALEVWFSNSSHASQDLIYWIPTLIGVVLIFIWVYIDSAERQYTRSRLLSIGVVAFALLFVPIYLFKSRPAGEKARSIGYFILLILCYIAISYAGAFFAQHVSL